MERRLVQDKTEKQVQENENYSASRLVMKTLLRILEFLFPRYCFSCGKILPLNTYLFCKSCATEVILNNKDIILKQDFFSYVFAPFSYEEPFSQAIKELKYKKKIHLVREISMFAAPYFSKASQDFIVCPVPLHRRRLMERGFNQSLLLARKLFPKHRVEELLIRQKHTRPQVSLKGKERHANVKGAFKAREKGLVQGKKIILFDDVLTTGATVTECAKTLLKARASEVKVAVLARAG